jgi:uncharacterized protein (TIGR02147 family)
MQQQVTPKYLRSLAERVRVTDFLCYREYLEAIYAELKREIADYSFPRFAEDLGFPRSNVLRLTIARHRNLAEGGARRVVEALGLKLDERRYFLALVQHNNALKDDEREAAFQKMIAIKTKSLPVGSASSKLKYFSEWYHPIIREMTALSDFRSDPKWIANRLYRRILPHQAEASLALLEELELIRFERTRGRHVPTGDHVVIDRNIGVMAVTRYQQEMLDLARESLTAVPDADRDFNTLTVSISPEAEARVREILEHACAQIMALDGEATSKSFVYQINTQMFSVMKKPRPSAAKRRGSG